MADIIGIGECMVEMSSPERGSFKQGFAGDIVNALKAAQLSGCSVSFLSKIGSDFFEQDFRSFFENEKIQLLEPEGDNSSANGVYFIKTDSHGERSFQYYRKGSAASTLSVADVTSNKDQITGAKCILFSGISQAISTECARALASLKAIKNPNQLVAYDVNYRGKLWTVDAAAKGLNEALEFVDVLFVSENEIPVLEKAFALDTKASKSELLSTIIKNSALSSVVLKCGSEGSYLQLNDGAEVLFYSETAPSVVDTSGAGDVFNGVFLAELIAGGCKVERSVCEKAQQKATRSAIAHIARHGALPTSL